MQKVLGIGGLFFRADDPDALAKWYAETLGIDPVPGDYNVPPWQAAGGDTVFAPFPSDTGYFNNPDKQVMINFRVANLDAMVAQIEAAGTAVTVFPEPFPNGRFAHLQDPEGNPIELWEPGAQTAKALT